MPSLRGCEVDSEQMVSYPETTEPVVREHAREQLYRKSGRVMPEERAHGKALCLRIDRGKDQVLRAQLLRELHELNERERAEGQRWMAEHGWETHERGRTSMTVIAI